MRGTRRTPKPIATAYIANRFVRRFWRDTSGTIHIRSTKTPWPRRRARSWASTISLRLLRWIRSEAARTVRPRVCTIFSSAWTRGKDELVYTVRGSGFLHHMVRNLVGTFILVGKGTLKVEDITQILEARNRSEAGATAPARGLYLVNVEY